MAFEEVRIGDCRLILGDAREIVPTLEAFSVLLTDPPYGLPGGARHGNYQKSTNKWRLPPGKRERSCLPGAVNIPVAPDFLASCLTHAEWSILWGGHLYGLLPSPAWLVWDKQSTGDLSDCELAWTNLPYDSVRCFRWLWNGFAKQHHEPRFHPTQKPLALMRWCLAQVPGRPISVLDPFAGSFTSAIACLEAGYKYTGIEIDPAYWKPGCRRVEAAYAQLDMTQPATWKAPTQLALVGR